MLVTVVLVEFMLDGGDLVDSSCVASTFEGRRKPDLEHAVDEPFAEEVGREAEDVEIVVPAAHFGRQIVVARSGPDSVDLVGGDAHTDARSAHEDSTIGVSGTDFVSDLLCDIGVIDRTFFVGAEVDDFMP